MRRTKKQMAMQAATAIAMKKAGKKPKRYEDGGAVSAIQRGQASAEKEIAKEEREEDLMRGRTFIPRMSQSDKEDLMNLAKEAMEKSRARRIERIKGKLRDLGVDPDAEEMEMVDPVDSPVDESIPDVMAPADDLFAKYGMKILKKYGKNKKRRR